jgi:hypothetical protein
MQMYRSPEDINQFTKIEYLLTFQKRIQEIFASFGLDPTFFLEHPVVIGIRGARAAYYGSPICSSIRRLHPIM